MHVKKNSNYCKTAPTSWKLYKTLLQQILLRWVLNIFFSNLFKKIQKSRKYVNPSRPLHFRKLHWNKNEVKFFVVPHRFYEGLNKGLHKTFSGTTKKCKNKNLTSELNFWKILVIRTLSVIFAYWFISMVVLTYDNAVWRKIFQKSTDALKTNNKISSNHLCHIIQAKNSLSTFRIL